MSALLFIPTETSFFAGWIDGSSPPMATFYRASESRLSRWLPGGFLGWSRLRARQIAGEVNIIGFSDYALVLAWDGVPVLAGADWLARSVGLPPIYPSNMQTAEDLGRQAQGLGKGRLLVCGRTPQPQPGEAAYA